MTLAAPDLVSGPVVAPFLAAAGRVTAFATPGRRVLVVDDDPAILELVGIRLSLAGCAIAVARNGIQALERLSAFRPEAMVLDVSMPALDGFGVLSHMREKGLSCPTLVLSAGRNADDVRRAIELGARDYLTKPFRDDQLLLRVARLLIRSRDALDR
ncbi:MAG TPA: response regulator [Phenylobacterium sp.]|nr:response regulator [Phenylobacterium sp.]